MAFPVRFKRVEQQASVIWSEAGAERLVTGMRFDKFEEHACAVQYKGVPIFNAALPENHPERFPYQKTVEAICAQYRLDATTQNQLLNAKLCDEASMLLNFDIKNNVGQPGLFYYGKFMAVSLEGKIDFCFLFYRLNFKISPDIIKESHAMKFLRQPEDFQNFIRLRLNDLLGGELRALRGLTDAEQLDALLGP